MNPNSNPNPNVMGQPVNPDTYNEHHPNLQPSTPAIPNPANEPAVFGPFGSTEWIDQLEKTFANGQVSSITGAGGQTQAQGNQAGQAGQSGQQLPEQLSVALQGLFQRADITAIRRTQDGLFEVDTKDGAVYQGQSLRGALQQIPNLDLAQPFTLKGQQGSGQGSAQQSQSSGRAPQQPDQQSGQSSAQGNAQSFGQQQTPPTAR